MLRSKQPNLTTISAIDALIVGIETQDDYLSTKKTWTRKIVLLTNAECPIELEDWEATVKKMDALDISLTIMSVVFPWRFHCFHLQFQWC
jgi:ATP-dependent DNA helicase 2 subunit 2